MKVPKVTSILLVVLLSLTFLNFILKYYTYFVIIVTSAKSSDESNSITEETGEIPHPHELYVPLLTFIPTKSPVLTRPWVIITSGFIEETAAGLVLNFILFFYLGKYLENMWGSKEFMKFIFTVSIGSNLLLYLYYNFKASIYSEHELSVPPVIISSMALNMGLFVAIKQRISNHYLLFFKDNVRVKITYLPFIVLVSLTVLKMIDQDYQISLSLSILGFIISWIYLRFFKLGTNDRQSYLLPFALNRKRSNKNRFKMKASTPPASNTNALSSLITNSLGGSDLQLDTKPLRGDRLEQFSLYTFFPYPISIIIKILGEIVFRKMVEYGVFDEKDFNQYEEEEDADSANLLSTFFGLSQLKGAQGDILAIPGASSKLKLIWDWLSSKPSTKNVGIKTSMDKRRKLALKELE